MASCLDDGTVQMFNAMSTRKLDELVILWRIFWSNSCQLSDLTEDALIIPLKI